MSPSEIRPGQLDRVRRPVRVFLLLLLLSLFCPLGPADAETAAKADAQPDAEPLTLGMALQTTPAIQYESLNRFAAYLASETGRPFSVKLYDSYYSVVNDFDHDALDVAIVTPLVYTLCMDDPDLTYLATDIVGNKAVYQALLLGSKSRGICKIEDLKGKKIGFVDRYSVSGYVLPAAHLRESGLFEQGRPLYEPVFLGSHEKAVRALLNGTVDAIGTFEHIFAHSKNDFGTGQPVSRESFNVLKVFPEEIPNDALVCRTALGATTIEALKKALAKFDRGAEKADSPLQAVLATKFVLDQQQPYQALREFLKPLLDAQ